MSTPDYDEADYVIEPGPAHAPARQDETRAAAMTGAVAELTGLGYGLGEAETAVAEAVLREVSGSLAGHVVTAAPGPADGQLWFSIRPKTGAPLRPEARYSPAPSAETEGVAGPANDYNPPPVAAAPPEPPAQLGDPGQEYDAAGVLDVIRIVDAHLDDAAPEIYRQDNDASRLLNHWRRIAGGPASEGQEAVDALNLMSGGNPRKGVIGDEETVKSELGDGVVAALLAIQHFTKDTAATWAVVVQALAKALSRVPRERPEP